VSHVVRAQLELEAVCGLRKRRHHDSGVIYQQIQPRVTGLELCRESLDRFQFGQVEFHNLQVCIGVAHPDLIRSCISLFQVALGDEHRGAVALMTPGCCLTASLKDL